MNIIELKKLWNKFGDTPINDNDEIEEAFLHFPMGTDRFEVWHWFEDQNEFFIIGEL